LSLAKTIIPPTRERVTVEFTSSENFTPSFNNVSFLVNQIQAESMTLEACQKRIAALNDALYLAVDEQNNKKPSLLIVDIVEEKDSLE
jgi:hypothetical protein